MRAALRTKLACSESLIELTAYRGVAMWWWADLEFEDFVNRTLNRGSEVQSKRSEYKTLEICGKAKALLVGSAHGITSRLMRSGLTVAGISILARVLVRVCRGKNALPNGSGRFPKIVFTSEDVEWRAVRDEKTGCLRKSDVFFDSVMRQLVGKGECVGVYPLLGRATFSNLTDGLRVFLDKLMNWYVRHRPFEFYWSPCASKAEKDAQRHFRRVWHRLVCDPKFKEVCDRAAKDIDPSVVSVLQYHFLVTFPLAVRYVQMAKQMIDKENPDLILLEEEYGAPFERALVVAAKERGVPTLGVQHGDIHPYHPGYLRMKGDISPDGDSVAPYRPIPDKTAVYGPYHEELLTNTAGYPPGSVVVTGQPRYDRLRYAERIYSREEFVSRHGIKPNNKIVLWATQCHAFSMQENAELLGCVLDAMSKISSTELIIKQHPGESEIHTRLIKTYMSRYKADALLTPKNSDVYEQLHACDLLITTYSTTATEAVALEKPVIILKLGLRAESIDYVAEGVAIEISDESQLQPTIERLLKDDSLLSKNRGRFIEKYLYRMDGKATERVINLISEMLANSDSHHGPKRPAVQRT
jgi:hypothetical protein